METLRSRIEHVTVYQAGAVVRRVATLPRPTATTEVTLDGLPLALRERSVRLRCDGGAVATDARVVDELPRGVPDGPAAIAPSLRAARLDVLRRQAEVEHLRAALEALAQLAPVPRPADEVAAAPPTWREPLTARLELAALRRERDAQLRADLVRAERALEDALAEQRREEAADAAASSARAPEAFELRRALVVTLHPDAGAAAGAAQVTLTLEYAVDAARWAPSYVARLDDDQATLELRAAIAQHTGEDWTGVHMTLSTAAGHAWTELPELPSLRIGRAQPAPRRAGFRPAPNGTDALFADWDAARRRLEVPAAPPSARAGGARRAEPERTRGITAQAPMLADADEEFAAMPPPRPAMAPAPLSAPTPFAAAAPMMPQAPAAKLAVRARAAPPAVPGAVARRQVAETASDDAFSAAADAPDETAAATTPDALLDYGDLRMAPADAPGRGRLQPVTALPDGEPPPVRAARALAQQASARQLHALVAMAPPGGRWPRWPDRYGYAFAAEALLDVPSDGGWHQVGLARADATLELRHVCVPRESTDVYRLARLTSTTPTPIIGGPLDVYVGGEFLLTTDVEFTPPRTAIEIGLGVDAGIKVARNARFDEETAGLLRGSLTLIHQVTIELTSVHPRAIQLELRERVPVQALEQPSDDLEISIARLSHPWEPLPASPSGARVRGGYRWLLDLPAGGRAHREVEYHLRLPSKQELVGGNRRES
jgi:hypothetical protein